MESKEQARENAALDFLIGTCLHDALMAEVTDEEIAEFMDDDIELTPWDQAAFGVMNNLLPPSDMMSDFIVNSSDKRDGTPGKASGCLLVWDDEILPKRS